MRSLALGLILLLPGAAFAANAPSPAAPAAPAVSGVVADPTGAIVPGAEVDLVDTNGAVAGTIHSDDEGNFQLVAPHAGSFTLVVSEPGFETVRTPVVIAAPAAVLSAAGRAPAGPTSAALASTTLASAAPASAALAASVHIVLPIAAVASTIRVNADASEDLTAPDANHDSSVMTSSDLKALPIFDNDYASAMSAFLDQNVSDTGGAGLMVDGVEANRATVSASAVQEIRINQDPYSAQYYWPGRGQMEIVTKSTADHYHGQFNFLYRNSGLNAQNALAPSKPFEQRQNYEGHITGPIPHAPKSSFLGSFNRVLYDQDSVVSATLAPTAADPTGAFYANVYAPARDTEFSARVAHKFREGASGYVQYSYQDSTAQNQGVGGQALAAAGYNNRYREDDLVAHLDQTLSATMLNQVSLVGERDSNRNSNVAEGPQINVPGNFLAGSAQADSLGSELNVRVYDMMTWTRGRNLIKLGAGTPHIDRRAYDDNTNALGTYVFGPTLASDGVTVLQTALQNYAANLPSAYTQNTGQVHFVYHQQEMGAFIQDQFKVSSRFQITPGIRYDCRTFSPRAASASRPASASPGCSARSRRPSSAAAAASTTTASAPARCSTWPATATPPAAPWCSR